VAIAGALVASPQVQHALAKPAAVAAPAHQTMAAHRQGTAATLDSLATRTSSAASTRHAAAKAAAMNTYYKVKTGDTLSSIARRFYNNAGGWQRIYHANEKTLRNPGMIYAGETLLIPAPAHAYVPRHAKTAPRVSSGSSSQTVATRSARHAGSGSGSHVSRSTTLSGTLSCSGLERLWEQAGGDSAHAFMAAEIAMAESGGRQYALSPTDDYGYWQINVSNGSLATFNAYGNARAAITLSHDGTDWYPWTTYTSGAYAGRC
jgi:LysM repeat protein